MTFLNIIPNWKSGVQENLQFRTEIIKSRNGKEQRTALRSSPRKSLELSDIQRGDNLRRLQDSILNRGKNTFDIQDFSATNLTVSSSVIIGATSIFVDLNSDWITANTDCIISQNGTSEVIQVANINVGPTTLELVLAAPTTNAWAVGATVYPRLIGRIARQQKFAYSTDDLGTFGIKFAVDPGTPVNATASNALEYFEGLELLSAKPDWRSSVSLNFSVDTEETDFGRGIAKTTLPVAFPTVITQHSFIDRRGGEINQIRDLFLRMKGRQKEFYYPSWVSDIQPLRGIISTDTVLTVEGDWLAADYANSTVHKALAIIKSDGTIIPVKIASIATVASPTAGSANQPAFNDAFDSGFAAGQSLPVNASDITLTAPFGSDVAFSEIAMICWLNRVRFASDTLDIRWISDDIATVQLSIMTLEYLASDVVITAPVAANGLLDQSFNQNTGIKSVSTASDFTGSNIVYSFPTPLTGVSVDASTGVILVDTGATGVLAASAIVVRGTNTAGFADSAFALTIVAVDTTAPTLNTPVVNTTTNAIDILNVSEPGTLFALIDQSPTPILGATIEAAVLAGTPQSYITSAVVTGGNTVAIDKSGVTTGTAYFHLTIKDAAGNYSTDIPTAFTQPASVSASTFIASRVDAANWTTPGYLFPAVPVANGRTVLAIFNQGGSTIGLSGITIGGVAMTKRASAVANNVDVSLWDLVTPGGTADIQTTQLSSGRCGIMLWDVGSRAFVSSVNANNATTLTLDMNTIASDTVIGYQATANGSYVNATPAGGWIEVADELIEAGYFHSGYLSTGAVGGAPEAFSITETVVMNYGIAANYR